MVQPAPGTLRQPGDFILSALPRLARRSVKSARRAALGERGRSLDRTTDGDASLVKG